MKRIAFVVVSLLCLFLVVVIFVFTRPSDIYADNLCILLSRNISQNSESQLIEYSFRGKNMLRGNTEFPDFVWGARYDWTASHALGVVSGMLVEVEIETGEIETIMSVDSVIMPWKSVQYLPYQHDFSFVDISGNLLVYRRAQQTTDVILNIEDIGGSCACGYEWIDIDTLCIASEKGIIKYDIETASSTVLWNTSILQSDFADTFRVSIHGEWIAFLSRDASLYIVNVHSGESHLIYDNSKAKNDVFFSMTHDGQYLSYVITHRTNYLFSPTYYEIFFYEITTQKSSQFFKSKVGETTPRFDIGIRGQQRQGDGSSVLATPEKGDDIPSNSEMSK